MSDRVDHEGGLVGCSDGSDTRFWRIRAPAIAHIFDQLLDLLAELERFDPPIVHRDIKPENLIIGDYDKLTVVDFGVAVPHATITRRAYTPGYAPPDFEIDTTVTPDLDRFAAGVMLFEVFTHELPYDDSDTDVELSDLSALRTDLSKELVAFVERACAADAIERFSSTADMRVEFTAAVRGPDSLGHSWNEGEARTAITPRTLAPYREWVARPLTPIESAKPREVTAALVDIVAAEGPIVARRAYQLYLRASGGQRLGRRLQSLFNSAMTRALKRDRLVAIDDDVQGVVGKTVYVPDTEPVVVRERGTRDLEEIPRSEVGTLMDQRGWRRLPPEGRARRVLATYGLSRLTSVAKEFVDSCAAYKWHP